MLCCFCFCTSQHYTSTQVPKSPTPSTPPRSSIPLSLAISVSLCLSVALCPVCLHVSMWYAQAARRAKAEWGTVAVPAATATPTSRPTSPKLSRCPGAPCVARPVCPPTPTPTRLCVVCTTRPCVRARLGGSRVRHLSCLVLCSVVLSCDVLSCLVLCCDVL